MSQMGLVAVMAVKPAERKEVDHMTTPDRALKQTIIIPMSLKYRAASGGESITYS